MPALPRLPGASSVWAEAHAALYDQLQRRDAAHALNRLARAWVHLVPVPCCVEATVDGDLVEGGLFEAEPAPGAELPGTALRMALCHNGVQVGELGTHVPTGLDRDAYLERMRPLQDTAAALLALWLEARQHAPMDSLSLVRAAMREGGTFVWEWDLATDSLGDIDEGGLMLGYPANAIGHTQADWDRLIHPEDADAVEAAYQAHARGETPAFQSLYRARAADGQWRWIEERGRVVARDAQGQPRRMFGTQTDATVQHALEQARRDQLAAEAANAAKTQFLSRVSHELRTPLNAVLGFAQLLEADSAEPLTADQKRRVNLIRQAGDYLLAMIGDLLDLSLVESGRLPIQPEVVQLPSLVADCLDLLRSQANAAQIALQANDLPASLLVQADAMRLKQVLINLLTNGIKYNRPGGRVALSACQLPGGRAQIDILDNGIGLPAAQLDKLFLPFQRLGREGGPVEGSGLGLALSHALVHAMGGTLTAHPLSADQGPGTIFRVILPQPTAGPPQAG
ncbi:MAG: HAMP domain-containing histidine kinase [Vitreoscilla sp.]|nr:HAMP domain-containing histidine kinase [Vitreoscilla sp.]